MPTGKPIGHPISSPVGAAVSYAPHQLGGGLKPLFKALGPGSNGELTTHPAAGTGSATFTRADGATDIAHVRDFENLYKKVPANEARFQGARRVRNLQTYSDDNTQTSTELAVTSTASTIEFTAASAYLYKDEHATDAGITFKCSVTLSSTDKAQVALRAYTGTDDERLSVALTSTPTRYTLLLTTTGTPGNIRMGLDNRSSIGGDDTTSGTITAVNWQIEEVSGQTNQAPSEYVATGTSAVTKYFYTENNNEVAENRLLQSRQFDTTWITSSLDSLNQNETGYDGQTNKAWTLSGSNFLDNMNQDVTIPADTRDYTYSIYIKKDEDESRFPCIYLALFTGGTQVDEAVYFNTKTGDYNPLSGFNDGTTIVEDRGDWWKVSQTLTNVNNTVARLHFYPVRSSSFTSDVSTTGSAIADQAQLSFDTSTPTKTQVETTTTAITNVVGTKIAQWEQVNNHLPYSKDFSQWGLGGTTPVLTSNSDGTYTIEDDDGAVTELITETESISDDGSTHCVKWRVKKQPVESYPFFWLRLNGGTAQSYGLYLNTATGDYQSGFTAGTGVGWVEDDGNYWLVKIFVTNNSSGNTNIENHIYPAFSSSLGGGNVATELGSITIEQTQVELNRTLPSGVWIETTGSAITLGKERGLDDQLHPIGVKQNATYFKRFDKWASATAYSVGDYIIPDTGSGPAGGNGYYYRCVVAGTSAGSEPSFGTTIGDGTYDNGVVWKCMGKATVAGYLAEPARTNTNPNSYDLTAWAQTGTSVSALDETGIDGVANHATTLTDDDGAGFELVVKTFTVGDDSNTHTTSTWIKKDSDTSRFPSVDVLLTGGTGVQHAVDLNTSTGATASRVSTGTVNSWVEDHGDWWRLVITVTNNTTGNTTLTYRVYPAVGTVIGTAAAAATGSCIVGHTQLELNTSVPSSPILTTGAADTRAIDDLYYDTSGNQEETQGSMVCSAGAVDWDQTLNSRIIGSHNSNGFLMRSTTQIKMYDGTNLPTVAADATTVDGDIIKAGGRWNSNTDALQAHGKGDSSTESSYDGSFVSSRIHIGTQNGTQGTTTFHGTVSDVLIYNKDLGTAELESMTSYD